MRPLSSTLLLVAGAALAGCMPILTSPHTETGTSGGDCSSWEQPTNTWGISEPPCLTAEGFEVGETPPDMRLLDQNGEIVSLWQFYGNVIVLDLSTMWCAPCAALAEGVTETQEEFAHEGFTYITMLSQDHLSQTPDQEDLGKWASDHGITNAPVLSDEAQQGYTSQIIPPGGSFPRVLLISRDMIVLDESIEPAEDPSVRAAVEAAL